MVSTRGRKKDARSKKTLEEKEAAENVLAETQVSDLLADRDAQLEDEVGEEEATKEENDEENNQEGKENAKKDAWESPDGGEAKKHGIEKLEASLKNNNKSSGRSIKKKVQASMLKKVDSQDEPKSSRKEKMKKRAESMGMIFMCNSETKKDCYQYMVLGLPKSKKDIVEKIYTGMHLFLYDIDLRLLYGIYRAAGRGGYNIEPKAFKRKFPSQVRFEIMEDCLPIDEEMFKTVITKSRSGFDLKLNSEQVKKLCRLFYASSERHPSKRLGKSLEAEKQPIRIEKNRRRIRGKKRLRLREGARNQEHPLKRQRKVISPEAVPRKVISPEAVPRQRLPAPLPTTFPSSYAYASAFDVDAYRQEHHSPYRDRHEWPIIPLDPHGGLRDPPHESSERYRAVCEPPLERHLAYRIVRDSHIDRHDTYIEDVASFSRRRDLDPYRVGRDAYLESPHLYRDGEELYTERGDSYRDGRALYLERRVLSSDGVHSDLYRTYRSHPLSESSNVYREDQGVELRGSYRRDERLGHRVLHPLDLETRNNYDVPGRELYLSNRERPSYVAPLYPSSYPSGVYVYRL